MERKQSVKTLKRTATWIDKSINLRSVLKEPRALKAFQDFAASIKAEENVSFWVAVEFFRVQHISTPKTGEKMRKRFSETLKQPVSETEDIFHMNPRHSVMMEQFLTSEKIESLDLSDTQLALLVDAARIFRVFLEDTGPHWTFIEPHIVDEIRNHLKEGTVDINLFSKAQAFAYQTMNRDIFPRFVKAIIENPQKYSTTEAFELPKETLEQLEKLAV